MKKKVSVFVLALGMMASFVVGTAAANELQEIKAYLNADISFKLDGETQPLKDASGAPTFPITYNNTTYLPVRSIANMLGVDVGWDQATQSVLLGKQPSGVDLIDTYDIYHKTTVGDQTYVGQTTSADGKTEDIAGVTKSHWVYMFVNWYGNATFSYNLQGKHDTLTFSYYSTGDVTMKITGNDGLPLGEYTITGGAVPKTVTLPLFKTNELKFEITPPDRNSSPHVRIFDAKLDAE